MLFLSTFFLFLGVVSAQKEFPGQCDQTVRPMKNFNMEKFAGVWYEITWMEDNPAFIGDCVKGTFTHKNGAMEFIFDLVVAGEPTSFTGAAKFDDDADGRAKLTATEPSPSLTPTRIYWILSTDYDNYYVAYGCENKADNKKSIASWVYSRSPCLDPKSVLKVSDVIKNIDGISWDTYEYTNSTEAACKGKKL